MSVKLFQQGTCRAIYTCLTTLSNIALYFILHSDDKRRSKVCMMTSSTGNIFFVTGHLCGEFSYHRWIPLTKASIAELWYIFFYLHLNKQLSKQSWGWWFETPSRPLWGHCNVNSWPAPYFTGSRGLPSEQQIYSLLTSVFHQRFESIRTS